VGWGRSKGRHGRDIPCGDAKAGEGEGAREERRVCASGEGGGVGVREPEAGRGGAGAGAAAEGGRPLLALSGSTAPRAWGVVGDVASPVSAP